MSRLELLLQVATFCSALGALVAGNDTFPFYYECKFGGLNQIAELPGFSFYPSSRFALPSIILI